MGNPTSLQDSTPKTVSKLLSAIACLLVRDHEVDCVAPKRLAANGLLELSASATREEGHPFYRMEVAPRPTIYVAHNPS